MRTILLLGVAAGSILLAGRAVSAERPTVKTETTTVVTTSNAPAPAGEAPNAPPLRVGTDYPPPPYDGGYDPHHPMEIQHRCGQGGPVTGAIVGGAVGGVVGNRVAGPGERVVGTIVGAGTGAVAGAAIGDGADRKTCEQWTVRHGGHHHGGAHPGGYAYGYGYGYGYGYYTPGVVVVTTITNGAPLVTETVETTTRTYYEKAPVRARHVVKKKAKPKAKPRCAC